MLGTTIHLARLKSPTVEFEQQWYVDVGIGLCTLLVLHNTQVKCEVLLFDLVLPLCMLCMVVAMPPMPGTATMLP